MVMTDLRGPSSRCSPAAWTTPAGAPRGWRPPWSRPRPRGRRGTRTRVWWPGTVGAAGSTPVIQTLLLSSSRFSGISMRLIATLTNIKLLLADTVSNVSMSQNPLVIISCPHYRGVGTNPPIQTIIRNCFRRQEEFCSLSLQSISPGQGRSRKKPITAAV